MILHQVWQVGLFLIKKYGSGRIRLCQHDLARHLFSSCRLYYTVCSVRLFFNHFWSQTDMVVGTGYGSPQGSYCTECAHTHTHTRFHFSPAFRAVWTQILKVPVLIILSDQFHGHQKNEGFDHHEPLQLCPPRSEWIELPVADGSLASQAVVCYWFRICGILCCN